MKFALHLHMKNICRQSKEKKLNSRIIFLTPLADIFLILSKNSLKFDNLFIYLFFLENKT